MDTDTLIHRITETLSDMKAEDIVHIDVHTQRSLFDHMMIATGHADRHVRAIAQHLATTLKRIGAPYVRIEGLDQGDWILVDAGEIIVHVMTATVREYYQLEALWRYKTRSPELHTEPRTAA